VTENDINVSQRLGGCGNVFGHAQSTFTGIDTSEFREHHHVQTGSTNNSETETDIDAISRATNNVLGIPSPAALNRRCPTSENSVRCKHPVLGTVFTSGLYLILFSEVGIVETSGSGSDVT